MKQEVQQLRFRTAKGNIVPYLELRPKKAHCYQFSRKIWLNIEAETGRKFSKSVTKFLAQENA
jgi:hypothetical protein